MKIECERRLRGRERERECVWRRGGDLCVVLAGSGRERERSTKGGICAIHLDLYDTYSSTPDSREAERYTKYLHHLGLSDA